MARGVTQEFGSGHVKGEVSNPSKGGNWISQSGV